MSAVLFQKRSTIMIDSTATDERCYSTARCRNYVILRQSHDFAYFYPRMNK